MPARSHSSGNPREEQRPTQQYCASVTPTARPNRVTGGRCRRGAGSLARTACQRRHLVRVNEIHSDSVLPCWLRCTADAARLVAAGVSRRTATSRVLAGSATGPATPLSLAPLVRSSLPSEPFTSTRHRLDLFARNHNLDSSYCDNSSAYCSPRTRTASATPPAARPPTSNSIVSQTDRSYRLRGVANGTDDE